MYITGFLLIIIIQCNCIGMDCSRNYNRPTFWLFADHPYPTTAENYHSI